MPDRTSPASNDLLADRRFTWAKNMAAEGDHAAAADLLEQVVERVPAWAPGWAALGEACERAGDADRARVAWAHVDGLDADGAFGAKLHRARLDGRTPPRMSETYVAALFDDYAPRFDRHLTATLGYCGPQRITDALDRVAPDRVFAHGLDLGCGTGLMGRALTGRVAALDGVDLSPRMVERARATECYAELTTGPLDAILQAATAGRYDLVTAADVLVYLGDLAPVLAGVMRALAPGGLFAFTAQALAEGHGFALGADLRFAHTQGYIAAALAAAGLTALALESASTRRESGIAVPGLVAVARAG